MSDFADRIVAMANRIARPPAGPGDATSARAVADHIATCWGPRMKRTLLATDPAGLDPLVARAVRMLDTGIASGDAAKPDVAATIYGRGA